GGGPGPGTPYTVTFGGALYCFMVTPPIVVVVVTIVVAAPGGLVAAVVVLVWVVTVRVGDGAAVFVGLLFPPPQDEAMMAKARMAEGARRRLIRFLPWILVGRF
ncbi:MAG: hypothetical protein AAB303_05465, partial [Chloroflexota bacterium]